MKNILLVRLGKLLMKLNALKICIVDDEDVNFPPSSLSLAAAAGFPGLERHYEVNAELMKDLLKSPRDIVILDIKGVAHQKIAKDGLGVAKILYNNTSSFVVITSAHKFHLSEIHKDYDYILETRLLTAVDFVEELEVIIQKCLANKIKPYRKILFKAGYFIAKTSLLPSP